MISATGTLRCWAKAADAITANSTQRPKKSRMFIRCAIVAVGNNRLTLVHPGFCGNDKPHTDVPALAARVTIELQRAPHVGRIFHGRWCSLCGVVRDESLHIDRSVPAASAWRPWGSEPPAGPALILEYYQYYRHGSRGRTTARPIPPTRAGRRCHAGAMGGRHCLPCKSEFA